MTVKQIKEKADLFLKQDNKMLDKYMDDMLGDLKLTSKGARLELQYAADWKKDIYYQDPATIEENFPVRHDIS